MRNTEIIDKDSSLVSEYSVHTTTTDLLGERALRQVRHEAEQIGIRWTPQLNTMTRAWLRQISLDLITDYAIPATACAPAPSARYLAAVMRRCLASGYKTAADAWQRDEADKAEYLANHQKARPVSGQQYAQRSYKGQPEINDLLDWIAEEKAAGSN